MAKDPIYGMKVDEKTAPAKSEYMGKTYYFMSPGNKKAFDEFYSDNLGEEVTGV